MKNRKHTAMKNRKPSLKEALGLNETYEGKSDMYGTFWPTELQKQKNAEKYPDAISHQEYPVGDRNSLMVGDGVWHGTVSNILELPDGSVRVLVNEKNKLHDLSFEEASKVI